MSTSRIETSESSGSFENCSRSAAFEIVLNLQERLRPVDAARDETAEPEIVAPLRLRAATPARDLKPYTLQWLDDRRIVCPLQNEVGAVLQDGFDVRNEALARSGDEFFEQIGEELAMNAGRVGLVGMVGDADDVLGAFVDAVVDDAAGGDDGQEPLGRRLQLDRFAAVIDEAELSVRVCRCKRRRQGREQSELDYSGHRDDPPSGRPRYRRAIHRRVINKIRKWLSTLKSNFACSGEWRNRSRRPDAVTRGCVWSVY